MMKRFSPHSSLCSLCLCVILFSFLFHPLPSFSETEFVPKPLYTISGYESAGAFQQIYSLNIDEAFDRITTLSGEPLEISVFSLMDGAPLLNISVFTDAAPPYTAFGCGRYIYFTHSAGIERYGQDGRLDSKWKAPAGFHPSPDRAVCGRDGGMAFLYRESKTVEKFGADGALLFSLHPKDEQRIERGEPEPVSPADICAGPGGELYVADAGAGEIRRYDEKGKFAGATGGDTELSKAGLDTPELVTVDSNRAVWVYDAGDSKVKAFDPFGFFLGEWRAMGNDGEQNFVSPAALFADRFGKLYMLDTGTTEVRVFNARGTF